MRVAFEDEACPVVGGCVGGFREGGELGGAQGGGGGEVLGDEAAVELCHQDTRTGVVGGPEGGGDLAGAGEEECTGETVHAFAGEVFADGGAAAAEHDELMRDVGGVDVAEPESSVLAIALLVEHGKEDAGEVAAGWTGDGVGGEVGDGVEGPVEVVDGGGGGVEAEVEGGVFRAEDGSDGERFFAGAGEAGKLVEIEGGGGAGEGGGIG